MCSDENRKHNSINSHVDVVQGMTTLVVPHEHPLTNDNQKNKNKNGKVPAG